MKETIVSIGNVCGYTSLAPGADQIFAETILEEGMRLVAVVPVCNGRAELEIGARAEFDRLCAEAAEVIRVEGATPDEAFYEAGKKVVEASDRMIFVWDGGASRGLGGTADVVEHARACARTGLVFDPIRLTVRDFE